MPTSLTRIAGLFFFRALSCKNAPPIAMIFKYQVHCWIANISLYDKNESQPSHLNQIDDQSFILKVEVTVMPIV